MPAVAIHCPLCTGVIQIDSSYGGQQVTCPLCQGLLSVPDESVLLGEAPPPGGSPGTPDAELVQLGCPICSGEFQVPAEMGGQQVGCPHCNNVVTLPQFGPEPQDVGAFHAPAATEPQLRALAPISPKPKEDRSAPTRDRSERRSKQRKSSSLDDLLPPGAAPARKPPASDPAIVDPLLPPGSAPSAVDQLLPPGASGSAVPSPAVEASAPHSMIVDTLLPPGAQSAETSAAAQQIAIPKAPARLPKPPANVPPGAIVVPTPEGEFVTVQETATKVIMAGNQAIEVRKLTPEEKAKRRMRKNMILGAFCLLIMFVVLVILMNK